MAMGIVSDEEFEKEMAMAMEKTSYTFDAQCEVLAVYVLDQMNFQDVGPEPIRYQKREYRKRQLAQAIQDAIDACAKELHDAEFVAK
jgi:hypothetical protein